MTTPEMEAGPAQSPGRIVPEFGTALCASVLAALVVLGGGLRLTHLHTVASRTPDERVYTRQANVVLRDGAAGVRQLVAEYQGDPSWHLYPPPTRSGYIWLLATVMRISGVTDERAGAFISTAASLGSLLVFVALGVRFFPPWATLVGLLLFAVSPMEIALARRTWQDALVGLLGLLLVYVACEIARDGSRRAWIGLFVAIGSLGIVIKESTPVAYGLAGLWVLYVLVRRRDLVRALTLVAAGLAGLAASVGWLASAVGGLGVLARIVSSIPGANAANAYAIEYQTGPAYQLLQALWTVSPFSTALCAVGCALALVGSHRFVPPAGLATRLDQDAARAVAWFLLAFLALPMVLAHWLNLRYVSPTFGPFYLMAGLGVAGLLRLAAPRLPARLATALTVLACTAAVAAAVSDVRYFDRVFVRQGVADLSIRMLLGDGLP